MALGKGNAAFVPVKCPKADCDGIIPVRKSLPGGTYPCPCRCSRFVLSWATYTNGERKPSLRQAE